MGSVMRLELETTASPGSMQRPPLSVPLSPSNTLGMSPSPRAFSPSTASRSGRSPYITTTRRSPRSAGQQRATYSTSPGMLHVSAESGEGSPTSPTSRFAPGTPRSMALSPRPPSSVNAPRSSQSSGGHRSATPSGDEPPGMMDGTLSPQRSRSRLNSRDGEFSPNAVLRAGGTFVIPRGGHPNKIRDASLYGGQIREDTFDHPNTRSMRENIDWIAGVSNPPQVAHMIRPFPGHRVGRSAPPDPYNVTGNNLWKDRSRSHVWIPVGPDGMAHDALREDWVRSEPSLVQSRAFPRARSPYKRHPNRCVSPEKMHPAVLAPNTRRRSESVARATARDMKSLLRGGGITGDARDALRGGRVARAQSPTFRGRITVRHEDVNKR